MGYQCFYFNHPKKLTASDYVQLMFPHCLSTFQFIVSSDREKQNDVSFVVIDFVNTVRPTTTLIMSQ